MLEIVADPRNGVPMHIHNNEEEHFIILEGKAFIANGDIGWKSLPVRPSPSAEAYIMLGAIFPKMCLSTCWCSSAPVD
jgi:hypothetical protein